MPHVFQGMDDEEYWKVGLLCIQLSMNGCFNDETPSLCTDHRQQAHLAVK